MFLKSKESSQKKQSNICSFTNFILLIEIAFKLWQQICGWSRGDLSSAVSWCADPLHACWAADAELWSSWVSGPEACTSYPEGYYKNQKKDSVQLKNENWLQWQKYKIKDYLTLWYKTLNSIHCSQSRKTGHMIFRWFLPNRAQCNTAHLNTVSSIRYMQSPWWILEIDNSLGGNTKKFW